MKYDFIEIGTSNFETLIENATDTTVGLSVEPIKYYLDLLPNKPLVKKINCAISRNDNIGLAEVYYVPEKTIIEYNLPYWIKGCNTIDEYHYQHVQLGIQHLVKKDSVMVIPISTLFIDNEVDEVDLLKIDTEGSDSDILLHLAEYIKDKAKPKRISFESNILTYKSKVDLVLDVYKNIGYTIVHTGDDTIMEIS